MEQPGTTDQWPEKLSVFTPLEELDEAIQASVRYFNSLETDQVIGSLKDKVQHAENGVAFAVLDGDRPKDYSPTEAILYFDSFSVGPSANRLFKAEFLREVLSRTDLPGAHDENGLLRPVVMIASPGPGSNLKLDAGERDRIRNGFWQPAAEGYLKAIGGLGLERVAVVGFSAGAKTAVNIPKAAYYSDIDAVSLALGEHPGVEWRSLGALTTDFGKAGGSELKKSAERSGLEIQDETLNIWDKTRFGLGLVKSVNLAIMRGMTWDRFQPEIDYIFKEGLASPIVVGYGSESAITKPSEIEPKLDQFRFGGHLVPVKVEGGNHTWGDQLPLLAQFYMRSLR